MTKKKKPVKKEITVFFKVAPETELEEYIKTCQLLFQEKTMSGAIKQAIRCLCVNYPQLKEELKDLQSDYLAIKNDMNDLLYRHLSVDEAQQDLSAHQIELNNLITNLKNKYNL